MVDVLGDGVELRKCEIALFFGIEISERLGNVLVLEVVLLELALVSFTLGRDDASTSESLRMGLRLVASGHRGGNSFLNHEGVHVNWRLETTSISREALSCSDVHRGPVRVFLLVTDNLNVRFDTPVVEVIASFNFSDPFGVSLSQLIKLMHIHFTDGILLVDVIFAALNSAGIVINFFN